MYVPSFSSFLTLTAFIRPDTINPKILPKDQFEITGKLKVDDKQNLFTAKWYDAPLPIRKKLNLPSSDSNWEALHESVDVVLKCAPKIRGDPNLSNLVKEALILSTNPSPYFVESYGLLDGKKKTCLVMKQYDFDLYYFIRIARKAQHWPAVKYVARQMIEAVKELHKFGIIHHDIKPENFLMDVTAQKVVLTDFELATYKDRAPKRIEAGGTTMYASPETLGFVHPIGQVSTQASDVYSLAVSLYVLLMQTSPFDAPHAETNLQLRQEGHLNVEGLAYLPDSNGVAARTLIPLFRQMLTKSPHDRLTNLDIVLRHPWLQITK